ncbi:hypothetical protein ES703_94996 [subsurface metagenome]
MQNPTDGRYRKRSAIVTSCRGIMLYTGNSVIKNHNIAKDTVLDFLNNMTDAANSNKIITIEKTTCFSKIDEETENT